MILTTHGGTETPMATLFPAKRPGFKFGVWGSGFRVQGLGFGVQGLGFRVWGLGFGVQGSGFGVQGPPRQRNLARIYPTHPISQRMLR